MTIRMAHVIDDASFGGVTRYIETLAGVLGESVEQRRIVVDTSSVRMPAIDADVVVLHATMAWRKLPFLAALRLATRGRLLIIVEHSYTEAYERLKVAHVRRFRQMLRLAFASADHVVAVSYGQAAWMRRAGLVAAARLSVVPSFTDTAGFRQIALPNGGRRPLRLGAFGRYAEQKGFDILIDAMKSVPADIATLELRGLGPDAAALTAAARELDNVRVGGPVEDVARFLAGVDAVVVPSRWEAFGQVALEARAGGRPVIASAVDGLVEQIEPDCGLLVEAGNASMLAEAIRSLADFERLDQMAAAARASAQDHASRSTEAWLDILDRVRPGGATARLRPRAEHPEPVLERATRIS